MVVATLAALSVVAVLGSALALSPLRTHRGPSDPVVSAIHTSGHCEREAQLVTDALRNSPARVDVDGDGRLDEVAVATDSRAGRRCRAFVAVDVRFGATYSIALDASTAPPRGMDAEIAGLPDLGDDPGAEIVVDTKRLADATLAQLFTLTGHGLVRVHLPAFEDGSFVVEGGGVTFPRGAGCTRAGKLRLSMATLDGAEYQVTRHTYGVKGDKLQLTGPAMLVRQVPAARLGSRFPEFVGPHWAACTGTVR
jgi:hypothetical protein